MKTTNRVRTEGARAFIPTSVTWNIPSDASPYVINVPLENYSDELNFEINHPDISVTIASFANRGVQLEVIVAGTVPDGLYNLIVISPGGITNEDLQGVLAGNELSRVTVSAAPFSVTGDDTIDIYQRVQDISDAVDVVTPSIVEIGVDTTLSNQDTIVAGAPIELTLPAAPTIGKKYKVVANGYIVTILAGVGQNINGSSNLILRNFDVADIMYTSTNTWSIV